MPPVNPAHVSCGRITPATPCAAKHRVEHRLGEFAGERVLLAGMVTSQEPPSAGQFHASRVAELGGRSDQPLPMPRFDRDRPPGDLTQRQEHAAGKRSIDCWSQGRQLAISCGAGLLSGGVQWQTAVIAQSVKARPSCASVVVAWLAKPAL